MRVLIDGQTLETPDIDRGIGIYFRNTLKSMLEQDFSIEWFITVSKHDSLNKLDDWVAEKLMPLCSNDFCPININNEGYECQTRYTHTLEKAVIENSIDLIWSPNVLMTNVMFPVKKPACKMMVTIHDLIPLIFNDYYFNQWPDEAVSEYKKRLSNISSWCEGVIFDSASTKNDYISQYVCKHWQVIHLGVSRKFSPKISTSKINDPFILYTGGFDYRKNMNRALEAFARSIDLIKNQELKQSIKYVVVCSLPPDAKEEYFGLAGKLQVKDRLIMTGFVSHSELQMLYKECTTFFFPSLYEGFGLPVLEAMASGAPVVISNNSSLPEVGGQSAYYCDPLNIEDMAQKLALSLEDSERSERILEGTKHAKSFTWEKTGLETLSFIRDVHLKGSHFQKEIKKKDKKNIAYLSPLLPQRSGIAKFSSQLLPHLSQYFNIDIFIDDKYFGKRQIEEYLGVRDIFFQSELKKMAGSYDLIWYHIGNNVEFHKDIYELAWDIPGIVELHDYNIHPFLQQAYLNSEPDKYRMFLEEGYGTKGLQHYYQIINNNASPDIWIYPLCHAIVKRSKKVIVHSQWVARQLLSIQIPVFVVPLFYASVDIEEQTSTPTDYRKKLGINDNSFIITCLGFINENKRPDVVIKAVRILIDKGYTIKLIFAGSLNAINVPSLIKEQNLSKETIITGYIEDDLYRGILSSSDIIVNLRYPTMGESSATLCEALSYGKATIVSNIGPYKEYPDNVCWKVDMGDYEVPMLVAFMERLLCDKNLREVLGNNGKAYANNVLNIERVVLDYIEILDKD